jgi:hypothetical protein
MVEHQREQRDARVFVVPVYGLVNRFRPFDHPDPTANEPGLIDRHDEDYVTRSSPSTARSTRSCSPATSPALIVLVVLLSGSGTGDADTGY